MNIWVESVGRGTKPPVCLIADENMHRSQYNQNRPKRLSKKERGEAKRRRQWMAWQFELRARRDLVRKYGSLYMAVLMGALPEMQSDLQQQIS